MGTSFGGGTEGPIPQDIRNRRADRGNSPFDIRQRFTFSWNYALPFAKENTVLGGWQMNGITTLQTGLPFTPTLNAATVNTGGGSRPAELERKG